MRRNDPDTPSQALSGSPPSGRHLRCLKEMLVSWWRGGEGASAVEFALIAPMLIIGLVTMVDVGLAANERMTIDHVLRSGAQRAMADPGAGAVLNVLKDTATRNFTLPPDGAPQPPHTLSLSAVRFCACPEDTGAAVACSTICSGPKPTFIYYRLLGAKTYKGMIIPSVTSSISMQVQIR
jgi:pilus assembly protein CpaE